MRTNERTYVHIHIFKELQQTFDACIVFNTHADTPTICRRRKQNVNDALKHGGMQDWQTKINYSSNDNINSNGPMQVY